MLSFDITDRNIRIIKGVENKNKINVSSAATVNIDEDIIVNGHVKDVPRLATLINQRIKQNRMIDKEAIVSISSNMTIFKELNIRKAVKEQEFIKLVKAEMQAKVGIDDAYGISYTIVEGPGSVSDSSDGSSEGMVTVLATACPQEVIDSYKRVFSMLGISLRSVMVGCNCITKVLLSDERNRSKMPLLSVQIDNNFISLNIYENNQLSFSRFASIDASDYDNSADYVYEAVNENIFRMLQFHKSRNMNTPIRNVILYGDTREYIRITKDLEQMDINTSVITVPKNVKGYQNFEFSLYANAIGAMFSRNKATEKVNMLEFGGTAAMISDKMKSDTTFVPICIVSCLATLLVMGAITLGFKIKDSNIVKDTKKMDTWNKSADTQAQLQLRLDRIDMREKIEEYAKIAMLGYDSLRSQPYIESEVYKTIEQTLKKTIEDVKNENIIYELDDLTAWDPIDLGRLKSTVSISKFDYKDGTVEFEYTTLAGKEPSPVFNAKFVENLLATDYFSDIENNGYVVNPEGEVKLYGATLVSDASGGTVIVMDEAGKEKARIFTGLIKMKVKSPVNFDKMNSFGAVTDKKGEENNK